MLLLLLLLLSLIIVLVMVLLMLVQLVGVRRGGRVRCHRRPGHGSPGRNARGLAGCGDGNLVAPVYAPGRLVPSIVKDEDGLVVMGCFYYGRCELIIWRFVSGMPGGRFPS